MWWPTVSRGGGLTKLRHEADDRQYAVGLLLIPCEAGRGGDDLLPRPVTLRPVELFGRYADRTALHLDLDPSGCAPML